MSKVQRTRGSTVLEFALASSFIVFPLVFGTATIGMSLLRSIRVVQLNRDAGHLFARGVDFSQPNERQMLLRLAEGLDITDAGGHGVFMLSVIECPSAGQAVCTRRIVIGNPNLRASAFANPTYIDSSGAVDYVNDAAANAATFLNVLPMQPGDVAYVTETYFSTSDYDWPGKFTDTGIYTRSIF